jgi:hypothetical protein
MKKLLILSVLLGLMALPMFASDITFGGDATYGFMTDFGDALADTTDFSFDIKAAIDDYSSLTAEVNGGESLTLGGIEKILVVTDVGMWAGLPVGLTVSWGYDDPDMNEFQNISGYGNEDPWDFSSDSGEYWGLAFLLSASMVEVELAFNPRGTGDGDLLVGLAAKEPIPGLNAEVYYYQNQKGGSVFDKGRIGLDAAYAGEFAGVGVEAGAYFGYDLDDAAADAWAYGIGLSGTYNIAEVTVGVDGNETDALNGLTATAMIDAIEMLSLYVGLQMNLADAAPESFEGADIGANVHMGAVEMFVGYLVTQDTAADGGEWKADIELPDGGAYVRFDVDY